MRVTNEMIVTNSVRRLSTRMEQYERSQSKLATGKEIRKPSDDPSKANRGLSLRASREARVQEQRNAEDAKTWLNTSDSALQGAMDRLQRARELTVQGANASDQSAKDGIAREIATIREELVGIANTKVRGQHVFAGYTEGPAVEATDNGDGTWTFATNGDETHAITRRVGDSDKVRINTTAAEAFGDGADSVLAVLDGLEGSLRAGDTDAVSATLSDLDDSMERLGGELARIGANTNWVDSALARSEDSLYVIQQELAEVEDADYAEAVMDLQMQDMALQSTLQALGRALPQSLAAFLR